MKRSIKTLALIAVMMLLSSFAGKNSEGFTGTYGVAESDPARIILKINADHTFQYQDLSVADRKIVVSGSWIVKGRKVILKSNDSERKFHNVWTYVQNGQVAKSRRGLTFYRLGRISD
jgi:hypothetical protein